jgi:DNA helicase-2/ATP-dependent DNA helicase PcrA
LKEGQTAVSLLTLHASKGLEFDVVFLVGLEQGLFPNYRSLDNPAALEEERRLCYVGITRAAERLYISHARERRLYGSREPAVRSQFLEELPKEILTSKLVTGHIAVNGAGGLKARSGRGGVSKSDATTQLQDWTIGDRVVHKDFGVGEITHIFGSGNKISLAIKFPNLSPKLLIPKLLSCNEWIKDFL